MNEKTVMVTAIVAVLVVGLVGLINFDASTGAATKTYDYRDCVCKISLKDNEGRIITKQPITTKLRMQTRGYDCQTVCELHYRGQEGRMSVVGIPGDVYAG